MFQSPPTSIDIQQHMVSWLGNSRTSSNWLPSFTHFQLGHVAEQLQTLPPVHHAEGAVECHVVGRNLVGSREAPRGALGKEYGSPKKEKTQHEPFSAAWKIFGNDCLGFG